MDAAKLVPPGFLINNRLHLPAIFYLPVPAKGGCPLFVDFILVLLMRIERTTSPLPRECSTTELQELFATHQPLTEPTKTWSGRTGSNRRMQLGRLPFYH